MTPDRTGHGEDTESAVLLLRTTSTIRERAQALLARARSGESRWFAIEDGALAGAADTVAEVTRKRYPGLHIPYHSRWRHFEAGGVDRKALIDQRLGHLKAPEKARAQIDLAVVSVLLDAGAGPDWKYHESATGQTHARSEGLGIASLHAFLAGLFSSDPAHPLQVDAAGLRGLAADHLAQAFQVGPQNPLVGVEGRVTLLRRLGEAMQAQPEVFGTPARPGGLFDVLTGTGIGTDAPPTAEVTAHDILSELLSGLAPVWPTQNAIQNVALGDCWQHPAVEGEGLTRGWMPFHKLSQWLAYSLLEPLQWAGVTVTGLQALTGLPEYRNGGLLLDAGVIVPRDPALAQQRWRAGDECIVEWRALTVALLDELAPLVRERLHRSEAQMPLACVLEGGTWAAGRELAQRLRGGTPPLNIESDATVF